MKLTKPWDVAELAKELKGEGLDVAEEVLKKVVLKTLDFAEQSVKLTPNKFDDLALMVLPQVKEEALKAIDKIDGEVG